MSKKYVTNVCIWLPQWLSGKESACNAGDTGWIPGSGRFPGEGRKHSFLETPCSRWVNGGHY